VRVDIGRIEVRAPAPPADPPAWRPPFLTLDDYLEREAWRR
jgi:hypothetical protein